MKYRHSRDIRFMLPISGPRVWNFLPLAIRKCENVNDFKRKLKTSFLVKVITCKVFKS